MMSTSLATLRWLATSLAACALAALSAVPVRAATGLAELPASANHGPVTVFYPANAPEQTVQRGPFILHAAPGATPVRGNGRLVVVSHGSGSSAWMYSELARHLVAAGFIVASPEHEGDNWHDTGKIGAESWRLRPREVSAAIDAVKNDARFAALADFNQVGAWGMSAGGHTALTLAGGRWSAARLRDHCGAHIDEAYTACTGAAIELKGGAFDGIKKSVALAVIRHKLADPQMQGHTDPRIKAIVAGVPFAADFDMATLANPVAPLGIVQAQQDIWLLPKFNSGAVLQACASCELVADLPTGGHGALLAPLPPDPPRWLSTLINDPPGFDRTKEMPQLLERTTAFFQKHLLPAAARP